MEEKKIVQDRAVCIKIDFRISFSPSRDTISDQKLDFGYKFLLL